MAKKDFGELATEKSINKAKEALEKNGIVVLVLENGIEAKEKALQMIPQGVEIMNMSSVTVDSIGLAREINESGKYNSVRNKLVEMSRQSGIPPEAGKKLGAAPDWVIGSVHAVTEDGKVVVVSATGSQLPAYTYGSDHVIWVVGSQKIVKNIKEAFERISEYVLPLENERAMKAYGRGSSVNKELVINKEVTSGRITMIIVKEKLGF
ncbi:MAG: LUD domain-containing protein [Candidatus Staskawiczbacteria bacterium]|nr:LUD domain-containing protein [Candidatus Staskawiczbacteria bacterium]